MSRILILEDNEERRKIFRQKLIDHDVVFTYLPDETIEKLKSEKWDVLCLDHDLEGKVYVSPDSGEPTGTDVARFLRDNSEYAPTQIILHSLNESGRKRMSSYLQQAEEIPFLWNLL